MNRLFCYDCLSEVALDFVRLRCRTKSCEHYHTPLDYSTYLQQVRQKLDKVLPARKFWMHFFPPEFSDPVVRNLEACPHLPWSFRDGPDIKQVCLLCARCVQDQSAFDFVCPHCQASLNLSFIFDDPRKIVPIFGGPFAGKTVLIRGLAQTLSALFDRQDKLCYIFNQAGRDYLDQRDGSPDEPVERLPGQNRLRSAPIILYAGGDYRVLYDVPGKWLADVNRLANNVHLFLQRPMIFVLIDPYSILELRPYLPPTPASTVREAFRLSAEDVLLNLIELYEKIGAKTPDGQIDTTLHVLFSKADLLENLSLYHPDAAFKKNNRALFEALRHGATTDALSDLAVEWLTRVGLTSFYRHAQQHFAHVRYMPVSALGEAPLVLERQQPGAPMATYAMSGYNSLGLVPLGKTLFSLS